MSQTPAPNLRDQVEALQAALNTRDVEAIAEMPLVDPAFEFHSALSATEGEFHVGVSGLRDWAESMDAVWANFRAEVADFRQLDEGRVLVIVRAMGEARGSGIPLDTHTAQVWSLRDGKVWRVRSYTDPEQALEAVGLSE